MAKSTTKQDLQQEGLQQNVSDPASQQLAVAGSNELTEASAAAEQAAISNEQHMQNFIQWMTDRANTTDEDQYAIMASILGDIMEAENPQQAMAEQSALSMRDRVGQVFILHGFEIRGGDYEESLFQHYAVLTVSSPGSAKTRIMTTGATKVLFRLYALDQFGEWPIPFRITGKEGKKGTILDIVTPE